MLFRPMAICAGAAVLIAALVAGCSGLMGSHTEFAPGTPVRVQVNPSSVTLQVSRTQTLAAAAFDDRGLEVPNLRFTWNAFNPAVATVDADGVVTAVAPGITSVSATYSGMIARVEVTVTAGEVQLSFDRDIKTIAALGCSCHQPGGPADHTGSMADLANITARGYVAPGNPQGSSYLIQGGGGDNHPGGDVWGANEQKVSDWIQQGARP